MNGMWTQISKYGAVSVALIIIIVMGFQFGNRLIDVAVELFIPKFDQIIEGQESMVEAVEDLIGEEKISRASSKIWADALKSEMAAVKNAVKFNGYQP